MRAGQARSGTPIPSEKTDVVGGAARRRYSSTTAWSPRVKAISRNGTRTRLHGASMVAPHPAESGICLRQYAINAELTGAIGQSRRSDTGPGACVSWPGLNAVSRQASRLTNASRNASIVDIHA